MRFRLFSHPGKGSQIRIRTSVFAAVLVLLLSVSLLLGPQWGPQAFASAPVTFQGTVNSAATGAGLSASITIAGPTGWSGQTDKFGHYAVTHQAISGTYTVTAASAGYTALSRTVTFGLTSPAAIAFTVNFALQAAGPQPAPTPRPSPTPTPTPGPAPTPTPGPAPTPGAGVYYVPASIPADCSRDVAADIASWIASVPNNSTLVFGANACYKTERPITVANRVGLTLNGNGALFRRFEVSPVELQWPYGNRHFSFTGDSNIVVRNMRIVGINTVSDDPVNWPGYGSYHQAFEFDHAFSFSGVQGIVVEDVSVNAVYGDGVYIGGRTLNTNARISRVTVDQNGRQGIGLAYVDGLLIENVTLLHSRRSGVDFEPNPGGVVQNVEVRGMFIHSRLIPFAGGGRSMAANIFIHNNVIDSASVPWVIVRPADGTRRHDWRVWDNQILQVLGSPMAALLFVNVDNVDVRRNISHVSPLRSRLAVQFTNASGALTVIGNDFLGACAPYTADALTTAVSASGNVVSPNCPAEAR
jgi:hypothetical protein